MTSTLPGPFALIPRTDGALRSGTEPVWEGLFMFVGNHLIVSRALHTGPMFGLCFNNNPLATMSLTQFRG